MLESGEFTACVRGNQQFASLMVRQHFATAQCVQPNSLIKQHKQEQQVLQSLRGSTQKLREV